MLSLLFSILFVLADSPKVLILGDSLTEGYGVRKEEAFPARLQVAFEGQYTIHASGIGGSTSASGPGRLKWLLNQKPKVLILALGANDGLRGLPIKSLEDNLSKTIELAQENKIKVILAGMQAPPNYGTEYTQKFASVYPKLAQKYQVDLIPFLLEGVAGEKSLNISDGIHPNPQGHQVIADKLSPLLQKFLKSKEPAS